MSRDYEKGQKDMLALIKDTYYKADKETFEQLLDAEDENELRNFLKCEYIKRGIEIGRDALSAEIKELFKKYGIKF